MNRILVIRGGAIGDFVLTLPALKLLRERWPHARVELLAYPHIAAIAENRFYAQAVRSIEEAALTSFFVPDGVLNPELVEYFAGFDLIVSYRLDDDGVFHANLRRCGVRQFLQGYPIIAGHEHAATQLARPLESLGLRPSDPAAQLFPSKDDRGAARAFFGAEQKRFVAIHPGSGSERKNWPLKHWIRLGDHILSDGETVLIVVGGEAEQEVIERLRGIWMHSSVRFAFDLELPTLAAILENATFIGHDSGISHLAAATGPPCLLLFGPTDPKIWAPANPGVRVVTAPDGRLNELAFETVRDAYELMRIGIRT